MYHKVYRLSEVNFKTRIRIIHEDLIIDLPATANERNKQKKIHFNNNESWICVIITLAITLTVESTKMLSPDPVEIFVLSPWFQAPEKYYQ